MKVYKALFVDDREVDNFLNRLMVKEEELPIEPNFVFSTDEAIQFLQDTPDEDFPDLIFIDIDMPVKTGFAFVEEYRKLFAGRDKTHLFFLTGISDPEVKKRAEEYTDVKGYFQKPIRKSVMEMVLSRMSSSASGV